MGKAEYIDLVIDAFLSGRLKDSIPMDEINEKLGRTYLQEYTRLVQEEIEKAGGLDHLVILPDYILDECRRKAVEFIGDNVRFKVAGKEYTLNEMTGVIK